MKEKKSISHITIISTSDNSRVVKLNIYTVKPNWKQVDFWGKHCAWEMPSLALLFTAAIASLF